MRTDDAERLAALWTVAQPSLAAFVRTFFRDAEHADEVLQRLAVVLVRKFDEFDRERSFLAWAIGMAKYEVLRYRRERAVDRHVFSDEMVAACADEFERIADDDSFPLRDALEACLERLEGRGRAVLEMSYQRRMKSGQVAEELGLSSGAVRMILCRARDALRSCIEGKLQSEGRNV